MAAERLFQCSNRLTIQCSNDELRHNPDWPKATCMELGHRYSEKRFTFLPYEGFRPLNPSFSANRGSILCSNTGISSTQRVEKMGIRCGEEKIKLHLRLDHQVSFGEHHAMLGSSKAFGAWKKKLMLSWSEYGWILDLETRGGENIEYKFLIVSGDGKIIWEGGHNRVLELPKEGSFELVCHWDKTQEALNLQRMDCVLAASQSLDIMKEATSPNGKPQVKTYGNVAEGSPFVQGWEGEDITFMRSNEHSTSEMEMSWNTSGLEGSAGKLVEGDQNARNWWWNVKFICFYFLFKKGYESRYTLGLHARLLDAQEAICKGTSQLP